MPLNIKEVGRTEDVILESKRELSRISEIRWKALLAGDESAALNARFEAIEKTLRGCEAITRYLGNFSKPIARELEVRHKEVRREFERTRQTKDNWELQAWIKTGLTPVVNRTETMAHVAASSVNRIRGFEIDFHRWTGAKANSARRTGK